MFNDLIEELDEEGFETFAYADDLAVVGYKIPALKQCIRRVKKRASDNNMVINRKKSGIIFHLKRRKSINGTVTSDIMNYPIKTEYKYLGVYLDINMKLKFQLDTVKKKVEKGMKMINILKWKRTDL